MSEDEKEIPLTGGGRTRVVRRGNTVHREAGQWSPAVHALLRHLEHKGFQGAPTVIESGFDDRGREVLSFIAGDFRHPAPWDDEAFTVLGAMIRNLHAATSDFIPPDQAVWRPWTARNLRLSMPVFGHCDWGPWNIVTRNDLPVALIDWENAGPVDAMVELAQLCWLNAQLCDDDIAERVGLPSAERRAYQVRLILDAYGLPRAARVEFVDLLIHYAVLDAADQAIEAQVKPETTDVSSLWGLAWRARAAAWMLRHRTLLTHIISAS